MYTRLSKHTDRIARTRLSSCLKPTAHSHRHSWGSYQDKDILALTLILVQAMWPVSSVPLGLPPLPSLERLPGLLQLSYHMFFKRADQRFGFNLFIDIPDIFKSQRLLVAFHNSAGTRAIHRLRPYRLGQGQSLCCFCQNLPSTPSSEMEGQRPTAPSPGPLNVTEAWGGQKTDRRGDGPWNTTRTRVRGAARLN